MTLYDFAKIYETEYQETVAPYAYITIREFNNNNHLWEGRIIDLITQKPKKLYGWEIVEMIVDYNRKGEENLPAYNKAKILKVV